MVDCASQPKRKDNNMAAIDWTNNPPRCEVCGATIRPHHTSEREFPGTSPYGARGLCNSCYRKKKKPASERATIDWSVDQFCVICGRKMRPSRASVKDWPNTQTYASMRRCSTCVKDGRVGYLTVRELFEKGHPCIEPCPLPSNKRSNIW